MIEVKKEGILLQRTEHAFENSAVLNPAVIVNEDGIHLFYRAVDIGNRSSIGYCRLSSPLVVAERKSLPVLSPEFDYESVGVEDPRIVKIDEIYYLSYTAYDGINALGALATSTDLKTFKKFGIIVPQLTYPKFKRLIATAGKLEGKYKRYNELYTIDGSSHLLWDKNVVFFPERIDGKICFLHRIKPGIQLVMIDKIEDLTPDFWKKYLHNFTSHVLLSPQYPHELSYIGGGCPPIRTEEGWLLIYHAVHSTRFGNVYVACAALLDIERPEQVLARLPYPLFQPDAVWEIKGTTTNVCFPTGSVLVKDSLYIYYGAADDQIACATVCLSHLLAELKLNIVK